MAQQLARRQFSVQEYYAMADAGILTEDDRVELIEGEIVEMAAIGGRHAAAVSRISTLFFDRMRDLAQVRVQNPIRLNDLNEPQPDITVVRSRPDFYASGHPSPPDVYLVVEVADSSFDFDRGRKSQLYGQSGVSELWVVDLIGESILAFTEPSHRGYRLCRTVTVGDVIAPSAFPDTAFAVEEILGRSEL